MGDTSVHVASHIKANPISNMTSVGVDPPPTQVSRVSNFIALKIRLSTLRGGTPYLNPYRRVLIIKN